MNQPVEVLPAEAWVYQDSPTADMQLYHPYAVPASPLLSINLHRTMGTLTADRRVNVPPELRNARNLREGFDFFDMARDSGATSADLTVNVVFSNAETAADLGPLVLDAPYEQLVFTSAMSVYGLRGSLVRQGAAMEAAELAGQPYQKDYYKRIKAAAGDLSRLWSCDPMDDGEGGPLGPTEELLLKVAHEIIQLEPDLADEEGVARYIADMVWLDQLQWYQAGRIGAACQAAWERANFNAIGNVTVVLPVEQLAIVKKLGALGVPGILLDYCTPDIDPDVNAENNNYGVIIDSGIVPAELFS